MKTAKVFAAILFGVSVLLTSCQKEPEPISVTGISLDSSSLTLTEGETARLTATISPSNADNQGVIWSSSNASVASVSNGTVTAISAGSATITAKSDDGGKTATCNVTVNSKIVAVTGVSLDKTSMELTEGDEYTLVATVQPANASNKQVSWKSDDETVATVSDGKVKAIKPGNTSITVSTSDGNKTATCSIKVNEKIYHVESVTLDKTLLELTEGDEATLTATVLPENANNKNILWSSSNEKIATVSNGKVKAIAPGTTSIIAKSEDGEKTATCDVTIKREVPDGAVDLGLSVLWATCNLGATSPEEYGDYYAWGETETKSDYSLGTYKFYKSENCTEGEFDVEYKGYTKYIPQRDAEQYGFKGFYDNKSTLDHDDDAAHVIRGGKWRMPTYNEFYELCNKCTWQLAEYKGVKGYKVISKISGYTDKWIFIPNAGRFIDKQLNGVGTNGYYWSSNFSAYPYLAESFCFTLNIEGRNFRYNRYIGHSVRPVCD